LRIADLELRDCGIRGFRDLGIERRNRALSGWRLEAEDRGRTVEVRGKRLSLQGLTHLTGLKHDGYSVGDRFGESAEESVWRMLKKVSELVKSGHAYR